jgi:hypothetical protein
MNKKSTNWIRFDSISSIISLTFDTWRLRRNEVNDAMVPIARQSRLQIMEPL